MTTKISNDKTSSRIAAERDAALAAALHLVTSRETGAVQALESQLAEVRQGAARERAQIERDAKSVAQTILDEFVRDASALFGGLVERWVKAPSRAVATEFKDGIEVLQARELREYPPPSHMIPRTVDALANAFVTHAMTTEPKIANVFGAKDLHGWPEMIAKVRAARGSTLGLYDALTGLELFIEHTAQREARQPSAEMQARWKVKCQLDHDALVAFDAAEKARAQQSFAASYAGPIAARA